MFEQFHHHFPQGSLISELVQIDHGKYIVRALVQNEGLTIATGLAAAESVEQAEDKARSRALAVLDISLAPTMTHAETQPAATASYSNHDKVSPPPQTTPNLSQTTSNTNQNQTPGSSVQSLDSDSDGFVSSPQAPSSQTETTQNVTASSLEISSLATETPSKSSQQSTTITTTPASTSSPPSHSDSDATNMDYSDIIARTNVELKRLQWTNEQGRKFLEQTYGKRSRQLLSEQELREFLQYLEKQPTPATENSKTE